MESWLSAGKQHFNAGGVVPACTRGAWALSIAKGRGCAWSIYNRPKGMVDMRSSVITYLWTVLSVEGYLMGARNWIKHALSELCSS